MATLSLEHYVVVVDTDAVAALEELLPCTKGILRPDLPLVRTDLFMVLTTPTVHLTVFRISTSLACLETYAFLEDELTYRLELQTSSADELADWAFGFEERNSLRPRRRLSHVSKPRLAPSTASSG